MNSIYLPETQLNNGRAGPTGYAMYCFPILLNVHRQTAIVDDAAERAAWVFEVYFVSSYFDSEPAPSVKNDQSTVDKWISALWGIRKAIGKDYGDTLAAFTLKAFRDYRIDNSDVEFSTYFSQSVSAARFVRSNQGAHAGKREETIDSILERHGLAH